MGITTTGVLTGVLNVTSIGTIPSSSPAVELGVNEDYMCWRYSGDITWTSLFSLSELGSKVVASTTNGNIVIDGTETKVYTLPSGVVFGDNLVAGDNITITYNTQTGKYTITGENGVVLPDNILTSDNVVAGDGITAKYDTQTKTLTISSDGLTEVTGDDVTMTGYIAPTVDEKVSTMVKSSDTLNQSVKAIVTAVEELDVLCSKPSITLTHDLQLYTDPETKKNIGLSFVGGVGLDENGVTQNLTTKIESDNFSIVLKGTEGAYRNLCGIVILPLSIRTNIKSEIEIMKYSFYCISSLGLQKISDTIYDYISQIDGKWAITKNVRGFLIEDTTNISLLNTALDGLMTVTNHGLTSGDIIKNITRNEAPQTMYLMSNDVVRVAVSSPQIGDTINKYKYTSTFIALTGTIGSQVVVSDGTIFTVGDCVKDSNNSIQSILNIEGNTVTLSSGSYIENESFRYFHFFEEDIAETGFQLVNYEIDFSKSTEYYNNLDDLLPYTIYEDDKNIEVVPVGYTQVRDKNVNLLVQGTVNEVYSGTGTNKYCMADGIITVNKPSGYYVDVAAVRADSNSISEILYRTATPNIIYSGTIGANVIILNNLIIHPAEVIITLNLNQTSTDMPTINVTYPLSLKGTINSLKQSTIGLTSMINYLMNQQFGVFEDNVGNAASGFSWESQGSGLEPLDGQAGFSFCNIICTTTILTANTNTLIGQLFSSRIPIHRIDFTTVGTLDTTTVVGTGYVDTTGSIYVLFPIAVTTFSIYIPFLYYIQKN